MKKYPVVADFLCDISAKKRAYSSTPVGFPIRNDLSAHSQGISEVFPTWMRTRRAPTYVRGLVIDYKSTSNHLPQDHTTRSNHLSDTTRSTLKPRTKPYPAPCQDQANTRLSTPKRALIFAQIHPIFVEICLRFAWDLLEVVHNQFNTHSMQLACSTIPTKRVLASPIDTNQSSQASPIDTNQSSQARPIVNVHSANDTNPTNQRHQADQSTTPSRLINDTEPTHQRHQADSSTTPIRPINDTKPTHQRHQSDPSTTPSRPINDTRPTNQRQFIPSSFQVRSYFD